MRALRLAVFTAYSAFSLGANELAAQGPQLAPAPFADIRWRSVGPSISGGRVLGIAVARVRGQPDQIYAVSEAGGVFKSGNGGTSWTPLFDGVNSLMSASDVAVTPSNPNIIWLGSGSGVNPPYHWGEGVYKSTDAGRTWTSMGLKETRHIGRIVVHPTNPDIVFVAAEGRLWGPNTERGVYKTTDGGRSWRKVLYVDENTGAADVLFDPSNPQILFATSHQRRRNGYGGNPVGPGSGIYRSVDGGETWTKLTRGITTQDKGRILLTISPADPKVVYADVEIYGPMYPGPQGEPGDCPPDGRPPIAPRGQSEVGEGGVYRTLDGGETWEHVFNRADHILGEFLQIRADPKDRNRLYRLGTGFYISDDLGKTFRTVQTGVHGDYRALWIDPDDPNHLIVGNDGGLAISWDRGATWDNRDNIPITQFWEVTVDNRDPYMVCGGTQDNGIWCLPSAVRNRNGISDRDAIMLGGGDGMFFQVDPRDTNYALIEVNSSSTSNSVQRLSLSNLKRQPARPGMVRPLNCFDRLPSIGGRDGRPVGRFFGTDSSYRWPWNMPIVFSSTTPGVVYAAANVVFRSTDRGGSWKPISPDLTTRVNRDTVFMMGVKLGRVNYSPGGGPVDNPSLSAIFGSVVGIGESPLNGRVLYAGTDDGLVHVTRDGGAHWTNVTKNIPGLPPLLQVTTVLPSRHVAGRVYATFDGHFNDDERAYVYVSNDYGQSWRAIIKGLPMTSVFRIAEDPKDANVLVLGHVRGVHFSNDAGESWMSLSTNMPTVPVRSVVFHARDDALVLGTYARGIWILDDVGPLRALTAAAIKKDAVLVSITRGRQWTSFNLEPTYGVGRFYAPNPEFDPTISYFIRDGSPPPIITIRDARGNVTRSLSGPGARGVNRVTWDMRMDSAFPEEGTPTGGRGGGRGAGGRGGGGGGGGGGRGGASQAAGPLVLPGEYSVQIAIPGIASPLRGKLSVQADPRDSFSQQERLARQAALIQVYSLQKTLVTAQEAAKLSLSRSDSIRRDVGGGGQIATERADSIIYRMSRASADIDRLIGVSQTVMRAIESFDSPPTAANQKQIDWAFEDATRAIAVLNRANQTELPALYSRFAKDVKVRTIPTVPIPSVPPRGRL